MVKKKESKSNKKAIEKPAKKTKKLASKPTKPAKKSKVEAKYGGASRGHTRRTLLFVFLQRLLAAPRRRQESRECAVLFCRRRISRKQQTTKEVRR